ncbi:Ku protein [Rhizobium sp. SGZ-381]|uniref:non-homologous end joining protein Ku n=1 Tax=Rhizobium sp. SGZ-381 TaxID=3342800 RepID=UPI00366E2B94
MARQTFWKGHLRLSLVTAAVSLTPAVSQSGKIRFHVLNRQTGNRVESRYVDSVTHKPVSDRNQVHGFPKEDGEFVLLDDEEIDAVALESTRIIDIETFVPAGSIDWIWYDRPHFLKPEDKIGAEAFGVIREAMKANGVVGIARLVLYKREHAVLLEPSGKGIILWTLHYAEEMREAVDTVERKSGIDKTLVADLGKRIRSKKADWTPSLVQDPIQKAIKRLLTKKTKDKPAASAKKTQGAAKTGGNVVNIMDALKKSLQAERK